VKYLQTQNFHPPIILQAVIPPNSLPGIRTWRAGFRSWNWRAHVELQRQTQIEVASQ
jgi:hypothetical protein